MIIVTIPNWRKKLIILACIILLAATLSIGLNYYKSINTTLEFEEMFEKPIGSEIQTVQDNEKISSNEAKTEILDNDNGVCEDEDKTQEIPDKGELEREFEEKEVKKDFWQKVLEKFRKE